MTEQTDLYAVSTADFDTRVLAASHARPILVDFWASWCAPCRSIAPLLEQLVVQFAGKMAVAKVDTDAEQALSQRYGIRSLPTLALFKGGAVVEQLVGVHPLQALVALVTKHLDRDSERKREEAGTSLAQGDPTTALRLLREALTEDPENIRIHPELAALLIESDDLDGAAEVLDSVPSRAINAAVRRAQARLRFSRLAASSPAMEVLQTALERGDARSETHFHWAIRQVLNGGYGAALGALIEIVRTDRSYGDDAARKAMLDIFFLMPDGDPLIREYRTHLARAIN